MREQFEIRMASDEELFEEMMGPHPWAWEAPLPNWERLEDDDQHEQPSTEPALMRPNETREEISGAWDVAMPEGNEADYEMAYDDLNEPNESRPLEELPPEELIPLFVGYNFWGRLEQPCLIIRLPPDCHPANMAIFVRKSDNLQLVVHHCRQ